MEKKSHPVTRLVEALAGVSTEVLTYFFLHISIQSLILFNGAQHAVL